MNYKTLMQRKLPEYICQLLISIGEISHQMGYTAFVVGGFVRDFILGRDNLDVDIVIEGNGLDFASKFAEINKGKVKSHERFGTAVVILPDGFKIDVATARTEIYDRPGALPKVQFCFIKADLFRRDFSINAMAIDLSDNQFGELVDPLNGYSDLRNGLIRVIYDLSFEDDPTRIFRAIKYEQRYGFSMETQTEKLLKLAVRRNFLDTITKQRLRNEILLILKEYELDMTVKRMEHFDILKYIHPKLKFTGTIGIRFIMQKFLTSVVSSKFSIDKVDKVLLNLIILLDQLDESQVAEVSRTLVLEKKYSEALLMANDRLNIALRAIDRSVSPSEIYESLKGFPIEVLMFGVIISQSDARKNRIMLYITALRNKKPFITGNDLKKMGYPEGPLYSEILTKTFYAQLDGVIKDKNQAIDFVMSNG